jgi:hypothetical protein
MRLSACLLMAAAGLVFSGCSSSPASLPLNTYLMGEKVELGRLSYTIFETQWMTHLGDASMPRVPQNRFLLIRLSAVNSGSTDAPFPNVTIQDDHGKVFEEVTNGESVPQWTGYLRTVKSTDSIQGNVVFDAPPAHYKLKILDETGTKAALIDLPLTFGAETPEIVAPGEKKEQ